MLSECNGILSYKYFQTVNDSFNGHGVHVWKTSLDKGIPTGLTLANGQIQYCVQITAGPYALPADAHKQMVATLGLVLPFPMLIIFFMSIAYETCVHEHGMISLL